MDLENINMGMFKGLAIAEEEQRPDDLTGEDLFFGTSKQNLLIMDLERKNRQLEIDNKTLALKSASDKEYYKKLLEINLDTYTYNNLIELGVLK